MEFCTECWQNHPKKYLFEEPKKSSCYNECPAGWTSNGDTEYHVCERCSNSCAECMDEGKVGDKDRCTVCKDGWFLYAPEQKCMPSCGEGFYEIAVEDDNDSKNCDKCSWPCLDCIGDKFNCIQCDSKNQNPALFTSSLISNGEEKLRSSCRANCP